jgi:hypothetical protein
MTRPAPNVRRVLFQLLVLHHPCAKTDCAQELLLMIAWTANV